MTHQIIARLRVLLLIFMACCVRTCWAGQWALDHIKVEKYSDGIELWNDDADPSQIEYFARYKSTDQFDDDRSVPPVIEHLTVCNTTQQTYRGEATVVLSNANISKIPLKLFMNITPVYKWQGEGTPSTDFWTVENGVAGVTTVGPDEYSPEHPYDGEGVTILNVNNGFQGGVGGNYVSHDIPWWFYSESTVAQGSYKRQVRVSPGVTEWTGPTRRLICNTELTFSAPGRERGIHVSTYVHYQVEVCNVSISATPLGPFTVTTDTPNYKEMTGITRWKANMVDDGNAENTTGPYVSKNGYVEAHVEPFMGAESQFFAMAKTAAGADIFPNQKYMWQAAAAPYPWVTPPPPPDQQPLVIDTKKTLNGIDSVWKIGGVVAPNVFSPFSNPTNIIPEFWENIVEKKQLADLTTQIPDNEKLETSTPDKLLRWDMGSAYDKPMDPTTVKVQATGADPGDPIIKVGKVKINWKHPKKRLFRVTLFPVEWHLPPNGTNLQNFCYTFFNNDALTSRVQFWTDVQIAAIAAPEVGKAAVGGADALVGARSMDLLMSNDTTAEAVANSTIDGLEGAASETGETGAAAEAESGTSKCKAEALDESGNPLQGEEADSFTAEREVTGNNCFAAGTPVLMGDGSLKHIEQVRVGDMVVSRDPITGTQGIKRVLRTFRNIVPALLTLTLGTGERIVTTPGHPFATTERGGFQLAGDLPLGTKLFESGGSSTSLLSEQEQSGSFQIYNFEVSDWHTYFVGTSEIWVHNQSRPKVVDNVEDLHNNYDWPKCRHGGEAHMDKIVELAEQAIESGNPVQINKGIPGNTRFQPDIMIWKPGTTDFTDLSNLEKIIEVVNTHEDSVAKTALYQQFIDQGIPVETVNVD